MIAIIDYGVGNLFSLVSSLKYLGIEATIATKSEDIVKADKIILPGVGAFEMAMQKLENSGMKETLLDEVKKGKYLLGICLGMQMLFEKSYEYGVHKGLGLISGKVCPLLGDIDEELKIPHMGWNSLIFKKQDEFLKDIKEGDFVYFVHSFYAKECSADTLSTCEYDKEVTAIVRKGNVIGTQFHPEKSGEVGLKLLKTFANL